MTNQFLKRRGGCGVALAVVGMLLTQSADAATYRVNMTGRQLVDDVLADPTIALNSFKRQRAMGYLDGIVDTTVNVHWCPERKAVPHELNYMLVEELSRLSADTLKGNAIPFVVDALRKMYPCAGSKS